jgi:hypothetical protein
MMPRLLAACLFTIAASATIGAPAPQFSWGKAGITLDQYRQDALECGLKGHYTDVSQTQDAKVLARASGQLENLPSTLDPMDYAATQGHIIASARPDLRLRNVKDRLQSVTTKCLVERGYSRFTLRKEQQQALRKLKAGSDERRAYLYGLASNPAILESQRVP